MAGCSSEEEAKYTLEGRDLRFPLRSFCPGKEAMMPFQQQSRQPGCAHGLSQPLFHMSDGQNSSFGDYTGVTWDPC